MTLILMWYFQFSKQLSLSLSHHLSYLNHTNTSQKKQEREQKENTIINQKHIETKRTYL